MSTAAAPAPAAAPPSWRLELPPSSAGDDAYGGCRCLEDGYTKLRQIGEGTYGQVYLARDERDGSLVALKRVRMDNEKEGFPITAIREIKLLKRLSHENVIRLKEIVRSHSSKYNNNKGSIYMVFDYMDHDLAGLMERRGYALPVPHAKCYMKQLLRGLHYCHSKHVLHRDLKASNLLISNDGKLKLGDFGLARTHRDPAAGGGGGRPLTNRVITLWYRPPELLLGATRYGPEVDMWSVGCIFAELLLGKPLFPGAEEGEQVDRITRLLGTPTEATMPGVSRLPHYANLQPGRYTTNGLRAFLEARGVEKKAPGAADLLASLLALDPAARATAIDASNHTFFWTDPKPADPADLPSYDASHELDMKRRRAAAKAGAAGGGAGAGGGGDRGVVPAPVAAAAGGHDAKRARHGGGGGGAPATGHHGHHPPAHAGWRGGGGGYAPPAAAYGASAPPPPPPSHYGAGGAPPGHAYRGPPHPHAPPPPPQGYYPPPPPPQGGQPPYGGSVPSWQNQRR